MLIIVDKVHEISFSYCSVSSTLKLETTKGSGGGIEGAHTPILVIYCQFCTILF